MAGFIDKLNENWLQIFRFNRPDVPNMSGTTIQTEITTDPGELVVDFGSDYLQANLSFMRNTAITQNRYEDYNLMDMYPLISSALDTIAGEGTQVDEYGDTFQIATFDEPDDKLSKEKIDDEIEVLKKYLAQFTQSVTGNKNFTYFRHFIKNGDLIFIPVYSEDKTKILKYVMAPIKNVKLVIDTQTYQITKYLLIPPGQDKRSINTVNNFIDAQEFPPEHVYHFSLDPEGSKYFPYGRSLLDPISYTYKNLKLMEESVLVYRITRAPERRVFYIDVGELPPQKAEKYLNDIRTKFVRKNFFDPNTGEVNNEYNPLSLQEDIYIPRRPNGAQTEIDTLQGAQNLDQLSDVDMFRQQIVQGLKVPVSYLKTGQEEGASVYNDGRVGTAYIAEIRFATYIEQLQSMFIEQFEKYFRKYLKKRGIETKIDFYVTMTPPSSYKEYKENELDLSRISNYTQLSSNQEFSHEFLMKKYLKWSNEEIEENKELRKKELKELAEEESENEPAGGSEFSGGAGGGAGGAGAPEGGEGAEGGEGGETGAEKTAPPNK